MCSDVLHEDFEYLYTMKVDWQKLNNKTVLVTGGTGFIGSLLLKYMNFLNREKGFSISLITVIRNEEKAKEVLNGLNVEIVKADLEDKFEIKGQVDYIFHCSCGYKIKRDDRTPGRSNRVNR